MKEISKQIGYFYITLPIVFVTLFFGLIPVKYEAVLHTDNIVGEGICITYFCNPVSFSPFYEGKFYFGSELKKATIDGYHYDVDKLSFEISDVSSFDIIGLDSYVWMIHLKHYAGGELLTSVDRIETEDAVFTNTGSALHVEVIDPKTGISFNLQKQMIPPLFWLLYSAVVLAAALLVSLLVDVLSKRWTALPRILLGVSGIIVTILAGQFFCGSLPYVEFKYFVLNWTFLYALSVVISAVTLPCIGTVATMGFTLLWYIANYFVIALRGKPIMPTDLKAVATAAEVMGGYVFRPNWQMILGIIVVTMYAIGIVIAWKHWTKSDRIVAVDKAIPEMGENQRLPEENSETKNPVGRLKKEFNRNLKKDLVFRFAAITLAIIVCVAGVNTSTFKSLNSFAWDAVLLKSFHKEGMVLTFLKGVLNSRVKKPEGYSREIVNDYLAEYQRDVHDTDRIQPTNIIMVMNEAFSDLRTVGLDDNVDVMPFIDSLQKNTIEGRLHVSVFGGGTCNTEFEGLTGNTLAFLATGAYPYTENVIKPMFSLASYLNDRGYLTEAFHANTPQNWNRNIVYPYLGFEKFNSISDYCGVLENVPYLHGHPADTADYSFIEKVDEENKDRPRFLFNVTMQNHSGYERWEDVEEAESVSENVPYLYQDTRTYLSLVKASDDAVKQLVETYQDSDEPTMIIFFGDHQPGLPNVAREEVYNKAKTFLDFYTSKFFIWTNYETKSLHDVDVSANFLPYLILKQGNFPLPPYVQMLGEVYEKYPVVSAMGLISQDGQIYASVDDVLDDPVIQKYKLVQYANMFDVIDDGWFETE